MKRKHFSRVDRQVSLLLAVILILFGISIYFISTKICYQAILESLTHRVTNIHDYIEHQITPDGFREINTKEDMQKESYQTLKEVLEEIRELGDLRYLYTRQKEVMPEILYMS